jgi:hypothetical protein
MTDRYSEIYSVFINREQYKEFLEYFDTMGETEAVEINGKLMGVSYNLPFPNLRY